MEPEIVVENPALTEQALCLQMILPVRDALNALSGHWKLPIIVSVSFGPKRFKQISKEVSGITDKMLSKELKELEENKLVKRTVYDSFPPKVEYSITEHGKSLKRVIKELCEWGTEHRKTVME
ncbi:MAG: winged helix-turn-helix transcriptional regulator [Bacteroidota bacterium]